MSGWIVSGILYALGVALDWFGSNEMADTTVTHRIASFAWPLLAVIIAAEYHCDAAEPTT